jgi:uncharacterized protein YbjT (DUF2867 family)
MKISIFGGNGFLGKCLVNKLAQAGHRLKIISRNVENKIVINQASNSEIEYKSGSLLNDLDIEDAVKDADIVINLVGLLFEKGASNFNNIHTDAPEKIAKYCSKHGVKGFIQISSLGVDKALTSKYSQSKLEGEEKAKQNFNNVTIIRPSIIFGADDNFYNQFAKLAKFMPYLPLIGGGKTKFQPVYVEDVATAIAKIVENTSLQNKTYELGGKNIYSFREILEYILQVTNRKRFLLNIPFALAKIVALPTEVLPKPVLTCDQVESLKYDNILSGNFDGFEALGIAPKTPEEIVPSYLNSL